uniref:Uncharacterized protein n=1 Tax=Kalanchoe fedtschenkoi TaxID=63787 RepID=A0A7N0VMF7_KALFE
MAPGMRIVFGLLTFVTVGMILGASFQLALIRKLEDSYGDGFLSDTRKIQYDKNPDRLHLSKGLLNSSVHLIIIVTMY